MKPILLVAALGCFAAPALAGDHHKHATKQNHAATDEPSLASSDPKQRRTPPAKVGGLLNTDVTPAQARRVAEQTNRQLRKGIVKQPR